MKRSRSSAPTSAARVAWLCANDDTLRQHLADDPASAVDVANISLSDAPSYDRRMSHGMSILADAWNNDAVRSQIGDRARVIVNECMASGGFDGPHDAAFRWGITMAYATGDPACVDACADCIWAADPHMAKKIMMYGSNDACMFYDFGHRMASRIHDGDAAAYASALINSNRNDAIMPTIPSGHVADAIMNDIWASAGTAHATQRKNAAQMLTGSAYDVAMLGVLASHRLDALTYEYHDDLYGRLVTTMHVHRACAGPYRERVTRWALEATMRGASHPGLLQVLAYARDTA